MPEPRRARRPPAPPDVLQRARILVADDQPDVLEALRLLLKGEGYDDRDGDLAGRRARARSRRATSTSC